MRLLAMLFLSLMAAGISAQGIQFFDGSWEEALEKAESEGKLIFVDGYAAWCGPCKRMSRDVFPHRTVGDYFNENFVSLKLDLEKGMGAEFRKKYPVRAFPTLFFISSTGKIVIKETGARGVNDLITLGKKAKAKGNQSASFQKLYDKGDRSFKTVYNLVRSLNATNKPTLEISNAYIETQENLSTPDNLKFLLEATTEVDSRIFDLLMDNKNAVIAQEGQEKFDNKIYRAGMNTVIKASDFSSESLFNEANDKVKKHVPSKAGEFNYYSSLNYYSFQKDPDAFLKSIKKYMKKDVGSDARKLNKIVQELGTSWKSNKVISNYAEGLAKVAAENGGSSNYYFNYGSLLYKNGKMDEALTALKKAKEIALDENANPSRIDKLIRQIEG